MRDSIFFVYYPCVKMESSNPLVAVAWSIVEFKMRVLEEALTVLFLTRKFFVTTASLNSKMPKLMLLILSIRVICIIRAMKQVVSRCFIIIIAETKRIEAVLKAIIKFVFENLCCGGSSMDVTYLLI